MPVASQKMVKLVHMLWCSRNPISGDIVHAAENGTAIISAETLCMVVLTKTCLSNHLKWDKVFFSFELMNTFFYNTTDSVPIYSDCNWLSSNS